jgi:tetratricopeptide (TPR) repeat protein
MQIVNRLCLVVLCLALLSSPTYAALSTEDLFGPLDSQELYSAEYSDVIASLKARAYDDARGAAEKIVAKQPEKYPGHLLLIFSYLGNEDFAAIKKHLTEVERTLPQFSPALKENVFRVLMAQSRYFRALNIIEDLDVTKRSAQLNLYIGRVYIAQSRYEDAAAALTQSLAKNNALVDARYELGRTLLIQGKYANALEAFTALAANGQASDQLHQLIGASYLGLGKYQEALAAFKKIANANPDDVLAQLNIGIIELYLKNDEQALIHLLASQKKDRTADSIAAQLLALKKLNKHNEASLIFAGLTAELVADPIVQLAALTLEKNELTEKSKQSIAKIFPDANFLKQSEFAYLAEHSREIALAALLYKQGLYLAVGDIYARQDKQIVHPWLSLIYARSLVKTNKMNESIDVYRKLGNEYSTLVSPKLELAEIYYHQKKYSDAINIYRSLPVDTNLEWKLQLGNLYNANQQYDLAIKIYTEALAVQSDPYIINQIAATYSERMGQHAKAIKVINDAKVNEQYPALWDTLGWAYYNVNDLKQSMAMYTRLLKATGNNQSPDTFARMARAYEKNGDTKQSRLLYEMSLNTGHEFDDEAFAQKKLAELDAGFK